MNNSKISLKLKELFDSTPDNVGVSFGRKIKNGKYTGELAFIFDVDKKLPLSEIPENQILPDKIIIDGEEYLTDIIETGGGYKLLVCDSSCYAWTSVLPLNQQRIRPLVGGLEITSDSVGASVGTLGTLCIDKITQAIVGITNNHVVIRDAFYTGYRNLYGDFDNEINDKVYQNYPQISLNEIGRVLRYEPIHPKTTSIINELDAAVVSINDTPGLIGAESYKQYGITGFTSYMEFATTQEIDDLINTQPPLISVGRTTGIKEGSPCGLAFHSISGISEVAFYTQGSYVPTLYGNFIKFTREDPLCFYPIAPGDSGSALIANFNGTYKIIGLVFASSLNNDYGIACRIDVISDKLQVEAWTGQTFNYVDQNSIQIITVSGGNVDRTICCSGLTLWQAGLTSYNNQCNNPCL